ncbi:hypothetical protein [uncultured Methylobacterium sp.]|uniref:hypothetical protein n=1 Tax=uncultured Methylobacterium sp. TaxID=157278 RepID=UPI0035CAFBF2
MSVLVGMVLLVFALLFVNYVVLSTAKSRAYRNLDPTAEPCRDGLARGWTVLTEVGRDTLRTSMEAADGGWMDTSNDELAVVAKDDVWTTRLRCSLQRHVVPATAPNAKDISYNLGFLEFQENGEPYALVSSGVDGSDRKVTSAMLRNAMEGEMHAQNKAASAVKPVITQLDVLTKHLGTGSHYVIVFIHGWRHDARIGDRNVADLRLYAAHAARFLAQRCPTEPSYCDMDVTGIYVGWRGARVDERGLKDYFGTPVGGVLGDLSAGMTLFDRKPVSEAIAPAAISALRTLEGVLNPPPLADGSGPGTHNRMIVAGHSLGGNMLATGLKDDLIKAVRRHKFGQVLPPVLGNLVVLINPASEATKWTAVQREVWNRIAFHADAHTSPSDVSRGRFLPDRAAARDHVGDGGAGLSGRQIATRRLRLDRTRFRRPVQRRPPADSSTADQHRQHVRCGRRLRLGHPRPVPDLQVRFPAGSGLSRPSRSPIRRSSTARRELLSTPPRECAGAIDDLADPDLIPPGVDLPVPGFLARAVAHHR